MITKKMKTGIEQITEERAKQIGKYKYTAYHDAQYTEKELLLGALTYLKKALYEDKYQETDDWPFMMRYYRDEGYVENLKKAGAFIAAELDRLNIN